MHNTATIVLVIANFLIYCGMVTFVHFSVFPEHASGIFLNQIGNLTNHYIIDVTPIDWTYYLWWAIFAWLLVAKLYGLILLCRQNKLGAAYKNPAVLTPAFLILYTISILCLVAWVVVWDREFLIASAAVMLGSALTAWISMIIILVTFYRGGPWMAQNAKVDLWLYRILWHNGFAAYTTWLTIIFLWNLGIVLKYIVYLDDQTIVYIVLGVIAGLMLLHFLLENTLLDRFIRYTFTPYAVIIVTMVGVFMRNYDKSTIETGYFIVVLLGVSIFCFVIHFALMMVRGCKQPLYVNNKVTEESVQPYNE